MLNQILSILRGYSLGRIKISLFAILIGGLLLDFKGKGIWGEEKKSIEIISGDLSNDIIVYLLLGLFIFMIIINFIDQTRKRKITSELISMLNKENIEESIKEKIIEKI